MAKTLRQKSVNQILYISIGSAIAALIVFVILFNIFNKSNKNQNVQMGDNKNDNNPSIEQASSQLGKTVNEVENETSENNLSIQLSENNNVENLDNSQSENNTISQNESVENNQANISEENQIPVSESNNGINNNVDENKIEANDEKNADPIFIMPVEGEIVKQYGKEKLIYSNTLKEWTTHLGIDIKADKTTIVKSSSDGIVKSIKNDPRYGLTIVIEHDNGYASIYSNLLSSEFVKVGENVKSGQTIGTVGNTATFEIVDDPHLHFEITKDGESIDPEMYIK